MDARVELRWLPGHSAWWNPRLLGTPVQVGAALDELARRITADTMNRLVLRLEPDATLYYSLAATMRRTLVLHRVAVVALNELPRLLRSDAAEVSAIGADHPPRIHGRLDSGKTGSRSSTSTHHRDGEVTREREWRHEP